MLDEEVTKILSKYQKQESDINELLQKNAGNSQNCSEEPNKLNKQFPNLDDAVKRNRAVLKELETVKGTLRSKAIYSPSEMQWDAIYKQYQASPALPITSWKCHMSTYV
ncbi:hypothetical protein RN001_013770 [Aquatica leii]|uniref:Uncharacterized protein n=1 Tax=Aquatica leii TaxID=1421715 RepID=A0AAN7SNV3_9COLE|nr:hypothetical protein RN001_013770 [Aquatica leii]